MSFDLKLHAYRLLMDEPFFACLSRKIEKREDRSIPTAGVLVNENTGQFEMIYNPELCRYPLQYRSQCHQPSADQSPVLQPQQPPG